MRRVAWAGAMFALTIVCVVLAAVTKSVVPVFAAWLPLLALVWVLNRPDPSDANWPAPAAPPQDESGTVQPDQPSPEGAV
jgi:hypothetical protein